MLAQLWRNYAEIITTPIILTTEVLLLEMLVNNFKRKGKNKVSDISLLPQLHNDFSVFFLGFAQNTSAILLSKDCQNTNYPTVVP